MTMASNWIKLPQVVTKTDLGEYYKYGEKIFEIKGDQVLKVDTIYDFDNDGRSDMKVYQNSGKISVFMNQNQDKISAPQWKSTNEYGQSEYEVEQNILSKHLTPIILELTSKKTEIPVKNVKKSVSVQNETEKNPTTTNVEKTTTLKSEEDFFKDLGFSESSGRYNVTNGKHLGKYQMAPLALMDTGYINPKTGKYTGKDGIYSKEDFLNSPKVQEKAIRLYMQKQWSYIKNPGASKIGQKINGIEITYSGLLAAAHLVGQGHVKRYINSNGKNIKRDGNGTSIESYLRKFANYDVSEFVGNSKIAYK